MPKPGHIELLREARRAGLRLYFDRLTQRNKIEKTSVTPANQHFVGQLREYSQALSVRLCWEANEPTHGQRPCPDCNAMDWVDVLQPTITIRPGGGCLAYVVRECPECRDAYRWLHCTWSYCRRCGGVSGSPPGKTWTRYTCGTCLPYVALPETFTEKTHG